MRKNQNKLGVVKVAVLMALSAVAGVSTFGADKVKSFWPVSNVNDSVMYPMYFGPTGIFTVSMAQVMSGNKAAVDQVAAMSDLGRRQTVAMAYDADMRARLRDSSLEVQKKIFDLMPRIEDCVEISKRGSQAGSSSASNKGGSGAGASSPYNPSGKRDNSSPVQNPNTLMAGVKNEAEKAAFVLMAKSNLGACKQEDIAAGLPGCVNAAVGAFSGTVNLPSADVTPLSLFGSAANNIKANKNDELANRTITNKAYGVNGATDLNVSKAYINNLLYSTLPQSLTIEEAKRSPDVEAQYRVLRTRIESSAKALRDIMNLSLASNDSVQAQSQAGMYWSKNKDKYGTLTGMKAPDTPSMRDYLLFQVTNDYIGVPDNSISDGLALLKLSNERAAVSNYLAFKQLEAIENINVQLASMNAQSLAPVNTEALNNFAVNVKSNGGGGQ